MKILSIITLLFLTANCAGGNFAQSVKFGKRCTVADKSGLQQSSYIWVVSKDLNLKSFDKRINKSNCLDS